MLIGFDLPGEFTNPEENRLKNRQPSAETATMSQVWLKAKAEPTKTLHQASPCQGATPGTMPSILKTNNCSINCFAAYDREVPAYPPGGLQVDLKFVSTLLGTPSANSFRIGVGVAKTKYT